MLAETGQLVPLREIAATIHPSQQPADTAVRRTGLDTDVPVGGATKYNPGGDYADGRAAVMQSLYASYTGCTWLSAPIDVIARTVTAGGVNITPDSDAAADATTAEPPPPVQALQQLLDFCNPHMDIIQLLRGVIVDLGIYGDAFIEVVWLLGLPVALYPLDPASMSVEADEHGVVLGYWQQVDAREVWFETSDVIHISMDAPKGSLYGMGIAQKAILPVTTWLFTTAVIKETMRKGDPPKVHMDFPLEVSTDDVRGWRGQYQTRNLGVSNIGNPITTRGGATLQELQIGKLAEYLAVQDSCRDAILSEAGVPPSKVGIIESGNLGGGTGTSQDKTFRVNTCGPIASIVLEKLNYHLTREAFGIEDWSMVFADVDWRDDEIIEDIRDKRIRNGSWTLNDLLTDLGQPTIGPEGDVHVLVTSKEILTWDQVQAYAKAAVAAITSKTAQQDAAAQAAKDHADAAKTAAANGTPLVGAPPAPPGSPPNPAAGATTPPPGSPPDEADAGRWRVQVAEFYRRRLLEQRRAVGAGVTGGEG